MNLELGGISLRVGEYEIVGMIGPEWQRQVRCGTSTTARGGMAHVRRHTLSCVPERIEWDDDAAHHIRTRSQRYPNAVDIEPEWIVDEPDPLSAHANSVRVVGYSHC